MPRYLFIANYSSEGMRGVLAEGGTARKTAVEKTAADVGGRVLSFDFAFGGDDAPRDLASGYTQWTARDG